MRPLCHPRPVDVAAARSRLEDYLKGYAKAGGHLADLVLTPWPAVALQELQRRQGLLLTLMDDELLAAILAGTVSVAGQAAELAVPAALSPPPASCGDSAPAAHWEAASLALRGQLLQIARAHFAVEVLDERNMDSLDFHSVAVWSMREALLAAYAAGCLAGRQGA